jgi:hypothetical protein
MNPRMLRIDSILVGATLALGGTALGDTVQTTGAGSAVTTADRTANFDAIDHNGLPLSDYVESGLFVGVSGDSWLGDGSRDFDPFHGGNGTDRRFFFPDGGSTESVVVRATDGATIHGLEFVYGNGWTTGDIYGQYPWGNHDAHLEWQTLRNHQVVSSGVVGVSPILEMGTVVGFRDLVGFDEIDLRCTIATAADPNVQALALDRLAVQLSVDPRAGTVDAGPGGGGPVDVLFLGGSAGGPGRAIDALSTDPFVLTLDEPPSRAGLRASYVVYAWRGEPTPANATVLPRGVGTTCMPTPIHPSLLPQPMKIANTIGLASQLGAENWPGPPTQRAPYVLLNAPGGVGHAGLSVFFQGIVQDDRSAGTARFSVTNGFVVRLSP